MRIVIIATCVIASTCAHATTKITRDNDRTITIMTLPDRYDVRRIHVRTITTPAPRNACATQNKFEILNARENEMRCVGIER